MSTLKKLAVLSMLVVMIIAFIIPASLADSVGKVSTGVDAKGVATSGLSKTGLGAGAIPALGGGIGSASRLRSVRWLRVPVQLGIRTIRCRMLPV